MVAGDGAVQCIQAVFQTQAQAHEGAGVYGRAVAMLLGEVERIGDAAGIGRLGELHLLGGEEDAGGDLFPVEGAVVRREKIGSRVLYRRNSRRVNKSNSQPQWSYLNALPISRTALIIVHF